MGLFVCQGLSKGVNSDLSRSRTGGRTRSLVGCSGTSAHPFPPDLSGPKLSEPVMARLLPGVGGSLGPGAGSARSGPPACACLPPTACAGPPPRQGPPCPVGSGGRARRRRGEVALTCSGWVGRPGLGSSVKVGVGGKEEPKGVWVLSCLRRSSDCSNKISETFYSKGPEKRARARARARFPSFDLKLKFGAGPCPAQVAPAAGAAPGSGEASRAVHPTAQQNKKEIHLLS